MAQSLAKILLHIVFSTKHRAAAIPEALCGELHAYMAGILQRLGCPAVRIGGTQDHVHILCHLSRTITVARVVEEVKTGSSKWLKTRGPGFQDFHWQSGYGVFSVSQSAMDAVVAYIDRQDEHHKTRTFMEEYRKLLDGYRVAYDERYVWD